MMTKHHSPQVLVIVNDCVSPDVGELAVLITSNIAGSRPCSYLPARNRCVWMCWRGGCCGVAKALMLFHFTSLLVEIYTKTFRNA